MVETDHVSFTSLFENMDADMLPPMLQRLRLKLMRYQSRIRHVPGKPLATVDSLSRAPMGQAPPTVRATKPFLDSVIHTIQDGSPVRLDKLRYEHASDGERVALHKYHERD